MSGVRMSAMARMEAATRVQRNTRLAFTGYPMRRKLMTETSAPAMGPKKKAIRPATPGRNGGLCISAASVGPIEYESFPGSMEAESMMDLLRLVKNLSGTHRGGKPFRGTGSWPMAVFLILLTY